jgi:periplasmic protein TonB
MKPTAVLLTVILFVGVSCITKDKTETITTGDNVLPEISVKEESVQLPPPPPPENNPELLPTIVDTEPAKAYVGIEPPVHTIGCDLIPPIIVVEEVREKDDVDSIILSKVEIEAEYPGGASAWQRFLNRNLRYPQEAIDNEISGSVVVQFVVDKEGNVSNVEAVSGPEALAAEAVRVIKKSGKWTPAVQGGRQVRSLKKQPFIICFETEG